jgi:nucleoside-diphosphate-sugar epimerase
MNDKIAILIGATGATGSKLLIQLLSDPYFSRVVVLTRRAIDISNSKLQVHIVDFDNTASWSPLVKGDVLFSALGTTLKVAKTKANQFKIDYTYQYQVAKAASDNGVNTYVLVSSYGANENSFFFYPKTKGKLDADVQKLSFKQIHIFRPGILHRQPSKLRPVEKISILIINALNKLGLLLKQKPMPVEVLADKMILVAKKQDAVKRQIHNLNTIFTI